MPFAIAMTLVILISTAVLVQQFWSGSLLNEQKDAPSDEPRAFTPPERATAPHLRADHAA